MRVPFHKSWHPKEVGRLLGVVRSGQVGGSPDGGYVREFEERLSCYLKEDDLTVVATNTGTSALYLMIRTFVDGLTDFTNRFVIIPDITFPATANAVMASDLSIAVVGVTDEGLLDTDLIKLVLDSFVGSKVVAVMPVHYGGQLFDEQKLREILDNRGREDIFILTDGAPAFGSFDESHRLVYGNACALSFHATKPFGVGEGGALLLPNQKCENSLERRARMLNWHGIDRSKNEWKEIGLKTTMSNLIAYLGCMMLDEFDEMLDVTSCHVDTYRKTISNYKFVRMLPSPSESQRSNCLVVVKFDSPRLRNDFVNEVNRCGVETRIHYAPLSSFADDFLGCGCATSRGFYETVVSLPIYPDLNQSVFDVVDKALRIING